MARRPFKKDLTPIGKGGITKQTGKGARESTSGDALTGASPFKGNNYSKPPAPSPAPVMDEPMGAPSAMMPGGFDEDA